MPGDDLPIALARPTITSGAEILRFFDEVNRWAGHSLDHLAFRALRKRFSAFSDEQIFIIVSAARRVFGSGAALH